MATVLVYLIACLRWRKNSVPGVRKACGFLFVGLFSSLCASIAYGQSPVSDAFNESSLNTSLWTVKAPAGGTAALSGGELLITVPGGINHQAYTPLNAIRVIQAVSNANFDVYVKINSQLTASAQDSFAGLLVGGDGSDWIYYYAYTDGTNVDLLCASVDGGAQNIRLNTIPFSGYPVPTYLRLQRAGTTYTAYWSTDAVNWTSAGSFNDSLVVTHLGPFAGNNNSNAANAPAVSAGFGGFENTPSAATVATPTFMPPSGTSFSSTLSVTIADSTPGATIYYTTDNSTPTTSSAVYSTAIILSASTTVKAIATAGGFAQSAVGAASYTYSPTQTPAATPTFTPASGTSFSSTLSVTLADSTPGATIYYTTDNSTPTTSSAVYSTAITLNATTTVKAIATASGFTQSAVGSASYSYSPTQTPAAMPTFTPAGGTSFSSTLIVNIADSTAGATIYYTTDNSTPTTSSAVYSTAITLNATTTVKAIAAASGFTQSAVGSASYIYAPVAGAPVSDAFNESSLNTNLWTVKAPAGGTASLSGGELLITVPGGSNHQAYTPLNAIRVIQAVSNANFDVYVKVNSQLTASAQDSFAGLLVGGDGSDWIYYYAYTDGTNVDLLCASVDGGAQNIRLNTIPFSGYPVPTYLRLQRSGTTYTAYWSADAATWTSAGSFNDSLVVSHLGPFAGNNNSNAANAPGVSAGFGGFENTPPTSTLATPTFTPASGTSFSPTLSVTIADSTPGATVYYTTDNSTPTTSSAVYSTAIILSASTTIKAIATAGGFTQSAVGAASYTYSPTQTPAATPTFMPASGTSFSSTLSVTLADSTPGATIYYTTDNSTPTTSSAVYSTAITLSATTTVNAIAIASGFTQSGVGSASYTYAPVSGAPVSDEFNESSLNTNLWTVRTPVGGTVALSNGELVLTVPGGSNHDAFVPALDAVQLVQTVSNADFDVAVKIDSTLLASAIYGGQGLMVEGDAKDYIRYEVAATGSISLVAATITSGTQTTQINATPFSGYAVPTYLRLQRVGTSYNALWSSDGVNWNSAGSFNNSLVVTGLAPYAWNYNSSPSNAPAITAKFDWFHNVNTIAASPTFTPPSGTSFSSPLTLTLADSTPGAAIYYTTDGSMPTTSSEGYSGSFTLDATTVVNAIAAGNGHTQSEVSSATYTYTPVSNGPSFNMSVAPASLALAPGLSQTVTVSVEPVDGFAGTVTASLANLPAGISVSPAQLSLTPNNAQQFTLSASSNFISSGSATLNAASGSLAQSQLIALTPLPAAPSSLVASGLMAYFPMSEGAGSTIHDVSSNAYTGTFGGSGDGWQPAGVSLNGQGWIDLPAQLNTAQTIQMWTDLPATNSASGQTLVGGSGPCCSGNTDWQIQPLQAGDSMQQIAGFSYGKFSSLSSVPFLGSAALTFAMGNSSAGTTDQFWINTNQVFYQQGPDNAIGFAIGTSAGSQTSGHYQIGAAASGTRLAGTVGPIAFYNRQLTPTEIASNAAFFNQLQQSRGVETQLGNTIGQSQFVGMGDSITFGYPLPSGPYCQYLSFNHTYNSQCLGITGQTSSFGLSEAAQFAQYYAEAAPKNVLLVWFGTNDVTNGTSVSQIFANLLSTCQTIKQVYPGWRVLLATMLSRYYNNLDYDPYKNSLNALIRENTTQQCDGFIDVAADPNLGADGAYGDGYFYDETHPTQQGYEQVATMITSYINSLEGYTAANPNSQSSTNYTMTSADNYIIANLNGSGSWTLPQCQGLTGKAYQITNVGSGVLTLLGANGEEISGSDTVVPGAAASFTISLISPSAAGCNWARTQ